jgi:hypothetical protein
VGYKLTGTHLVPVSPAQFSSGQISAIGDLVTNYVTNYLYGCLLHGASDFFSQADPEFRLPLALACSSLFVAGHLFFGRAQYAAGSNKVRFPALSNEILEMSGVNMIRPNEGCEAIESPPPPALKGNWINIRVKHTPACFYQFVDSPVDSHC